MLIVLTAEDNREDELELIHQMFKLGLECLHIRKIGMSKEAYRSFLCKINEAYLSRIIIHQDHDLLNEFDLGGIHLTAKKRMNLGEGVYDYINNLKQLKSISVSSSFHELDEFDRNNSLYDYVFLSPVFDSISKLGYRGKEFNVNGIGQNIIALGGVCTENTNIVKALGYNGIAVIGCVWKAKDVLSSFKRLSAVYKTGEIL